MKRFQRYSVKAALVALSGACFAAAMTARAAPQPGPGAPPPAAAPAVQGPAEVCLDVQSHDAETEAFADRLRETIAASRSLSLAGATASCTVQLHVPGNLLRFETESGVMVSAVVIVTSASGRYLSASISACEANHLEPCAVRAVTATKLALLVNANDGT